MLGTAASIPGIVVTFTLGAGAGVAGVGIAGGCVGVGVAGAGVFGVGVDTDGSFMHHAPDYALLLGHPATKC